MFAENSLIFNFYVRRLFAFHDLLINRINLGLKKTYTFFSFKRGESKTDSCLTTDEIFQTNHLLGQLYVLFGLLMIFLGSFLSHLTMWAFCHQNLLCVWLLIIVDCSLTFEDIIFYPSRPFLPLMLTLDSNPWHLRQEVSKKIGFSNCKKNYWIPFLTNFDIFEIERLKRYSNLFSFNSDL